MLTRREFLCKITERWGVVQNPHSLYYFNNYCKKKDKTIELKKRYRTM